MTSSFSDLKKSRRSSLEALIKETQKENSPAQSQNDSSDDRYWKPEVDKAGNGYAVIRFLPAPEGEELPWVRLFNHGFQGPGGWYIENSLTTIGKKDPVSEYNSTLWHRGDDAGKDQARKQKRRLTYIANIFVVKDPTNPANEGKVFLYKFGKRIFDKLNDLMNPQFEDEQPVNPFDLWEGANLKLKIRNVEGYRNYDKSEFDSPAPLLDDDDALEAIWKTEYSLAEFLDPKNFKSYEELEQRLHKALNLSGGAKPQATATDEDDEIALSRPTRQAEPPKREEAVPAAVAIEEDDDDLSFFEKLAEDD